MDGSGKDRAPNRERELWLPMRASSVTHLRQQSPGSTFLDHPHRDGARAQSHHNPTSRSDPMYFRESWRERGDGDSFTHRPSNTYGGNPDRPAPLRVAELRRHASINSQRDHHGHASRSWASARESNSPNEQDYGHQYLKQDDLAYDEHELRQSRQVSSRGESRHVNGAITGSREELFARSPRSFDCVRSPGVSNQYVEASPWGSPSSYTSSHDSAFSSLDELNAWSDLRIGTSGDLPTGSGSPAPSSSLDERSQRDDNLRSSNDKAKVTHTRSQSSVKQSRYFREMDRRIILSRLAKGEKQAALAKEYGVSRSTICNLRKQRDIVLARVDENPLSRHPKKSRQSRQSSVTAATLPMLPLENQQAVSAPVRALLNDDEDKRSPEPAQQLEFLSFDTNLVIEVESRAIALLKTKLHDRETTNDDFKRSYTRLGRLLLEETIGIVATCSHPAQNEPSLTEIICVIAIGESGTALLHIFRQLEPEISTGLIDHALVNPSQLELHVISHQSNLTNREVLLLDAVWACGDTACSAIDLLRSSGVREDQITLVGLFVAAEVVALVQYVHPRVRIITTGVDVQLHKRRGTTTNATEPSSSAQIFLERFLQTS